MVKIYYVEGIIGAGKSTFIKSVKDYIEKHHPDIRVLALFEPIEEWEKSGLFKLFYNDKTRWAYTFQTFVYTSRCNQVLNHAELFDMYDIILIERSIWSDKYFFMDSMFNAGVITPEEYEAYNMSWKLHSSLMNFEYSFIFLNTDVEKSMERIKKRARHDEIVDEEYERGLHTSHVEFFKGCKNHVEIKTDEELTSLSFLSGICRTIFNV